MSLAGVFASGFAAVSIAIATWRYAFAPILIGLAVVTVLYSGWSSEPHTIQKPTLEIWPTLRRIALTRGFDRRFSSRACSCSSGTARSASFRSSSRPIGARGASNVAYAAVFAVGVLATPLSGYCGDRIGSLPPLSPRSEAVSSVSRCSYFSSTVGVAVGILLLAVD